MIPTRPDGKGILRAFDPLQCPEKKLHVDVVMNLTLFLQSNAPRPAPNGFRADQNWEKDLKDLKQNISIYSTLSPSVRPEFRMELVISVNGYVTDAEPIEYLKSIDNTFVNNNRIHITVFQRPNVGWQWGALQDIWQRWHHSVICDFWMTQESDCYFHKENWFDILYDKYKCHEKEKICFISGRERTFLFNEPLEFDGPLSPETWRDKDNKPLENITEWSLRHVDPLYYFIPSKYLDDLDRHFGCFTYALDSNYQLDAIIYGEIGFCQKARALRYKWLECQDIVHGWDAPGKWKNEML